jgi:acyl carrier protein
MAKKKSSKKPYGPYKGYYPQKYLYEYLKIEIDPYDMPHKFLEEWAEEVGVKIDDDDFADVLTPNQLKAYEAWLVENEKGIELVTQDPADAPAYLTIQSPKIMPRGTWAIHFTGSEPFKAFQQGATIPRLALSTWWKEKERARCPENITDQLGTYEYVYIFAFDAIKRDVIWHGAKYGRNAVLFQTDGAVEARHIGDEEDQLIIPACSEYNMIQIRGIGEGISCGFDDSDEEGLSFDTIKDLISYVEQAEARGERPLERLKC